MTGPAAAEVPIRATAMRVGALPSPAIDVDRQETQGNATQMMIIAGDFIEITVRGLGRSAFVIETRRSCYSLRHEQELISQEPTHVGISVTKLSTD